ncbi:hypothetical protein ON010_g8628 [Phytophthora cinnamomi]|nr:hypothetical protein ON010_g8628 [Phytophthora cinnamomi]
MRAPHKRLFLVCDSSNTSVHVFRHLSQHGDRPQILGSGILHTDSTHYVLFQNTTIPLNHSCNAIAQAKHAKVQTEIGERNWDHEPAKEVPAQFMDEFNDELVRMGWVYENNESRWACPARPVRKAGGEFRQTSVYKPINADIEAIVGVMPDLHVDLESVKGATFFGPLDFIKGYWQLGLTEEYQEWRSYMTHRKVYTPRRVPQGCTDAALFFSVDGPKVPGGASP